MSEPISVTDTHIVDAASATSPEASLGPAPILPLELVDKNIGSRIWVILRNGLEFKGTLIGFDDYVNMVLKDVSE